jgi:hypothetical protein
MDLRSEPNFQGVLFPASLDVNSIVTKDTPGSHRGFSSVKQRWESAHQFGALFTNTFCMIFKIFAIGVNFVEITNSVFRVIQTTDILHEVKYLPSCSIVPILQIIFFMLKICEITICAYLIYFPVMIKYC